MYLEREIKKLFEDARDALLAGGAKDFETYATLNARYQVLRELNGKTQADEMQLRQAELASNIGTVSMGHVIDMLNARLRADAEKAKLAAKTRGMN
jgi:hypothetical protein